MIQKLIDKLYLKFGKLPKQKSFLDFRFDQELGWCHDNSFTYARVVKLIAACMGEPEHIAERKLEEVLRREVYKTRGLGS